MTARRLRKKKEIQDKIDQLIGKEQELRYDNGQIQDWIDALEWTLNRSLHLTLQEEIEK